jgi:molybdopterin/thiamine biosynthesis adenylyltransferase
MRNPEVIPMKIAVQQRYVANLGIMTPVEWERLAKTRVLLVGLGGLGGHLANSLVRLGIRSLTLVDFDRFDESNLNRQLFSTPDAIGRFKADVLCEELKKINSNLELKKNCVMVQEVDSAIFETTDVIIDAVDDIKTKLYLETMGKNHLKPVLHGAVGGWYGQVGILTPGSNLLSQIYQDATAGIEQIQGSPTFTPAVVANMMAGELVKYILRRSEALIDQILMIDLLHHEYRIVCRKANPGVK